jgi:5-methyltetrahydrofolate--homocysteine methyltransferase
VLATVYGDVHDIGKSLVNTILSNNGYTVFDLGKQVPVNTIIEKALEVEADAIGLSALLVSTSKQMPLCVQELDKRGIQIPVLIGGAAINRRFGRPRTVRRARARVRVRRCSTARTRSRGSRRWTRCRGATSDARRRSRSCCRRRGATSFLQGNVGRTSHRGSRAASAATVARSCSSRRALPRHARARDIPLDEVFELLDLDELYRLQWGGAARAEYERMVREEFEPALARLKREAIAEGWLHPKAVYGYFPTRASATSSSSTSPSRTRATARWSRRRGSTSRGRRARAAVHRGLLPLVDERRRRRRGVPDRHGRRRSDAPVRAQQAAGEYSEAFYQHGLAVESAEAVAEWLHRRIRRELGIPGGRGKRYSWGYGACPDLEDHAQLSSCCRQRRRSGWSSTSAFQLIPEQSTAAVIVHHPQSKYYAVRTAAEGAAA